MTPKTHNAEVSSVVVTGRQTIYTHPGTSAETRLLTITQRERNRPVTLDEVQRTPPLLLAVKRAVDELEDRLASPNQVGDLDEELSAAWKGELLGNQSDDCRKFLALFDLATGMLLSIAPAPLRSHEMSRCAVATAGMAPGDIALGDRGFCSFAHLAILLNRKQHGVFRAHQRQIIDFTPGRPGGPGSKRKRPNAVIRPSSSKPTASATGGRCWTGCAECRT